MLRKLAIGLLSILLTLAMTMPIIDLKPSDNAFEPFCINPNVEGKK